MPANKNPSSRLRVRSSGVNAAAVRRLAANHAAAPAEPAPPAGSAVTSSAGVSSAVSESAVTQSAGVSSRATAVRESPEPDAAVLDDAAPASESDRVDEVDGADDSDVAEATDVDATDGDAVDADAAGADADADAAGGRRLARLPWRMITLVSLAVATLVFGGLAAWFGTEAGSLNGEPSAQNLALSNPGETGQVTSQMTSAIGALFSYNYANPAPTQKAATRLLTGSAVSQYSTMIAPVKKDAQKDKLVVTTTVSNIGVEMLTGNTARVLVFATESDGSAGATTPTTAEAMLAVNAVLDGSTWKIEGIDTFSG